MGHRPLRGCERPDHSSTFKGDIDGRTPGEHQVPEPGAAFVIQRDDLAVQNAAGRQSRQQRLEPVHPVAAAGQHPPARRVGQGPEPVEFQFEGSRWVMERLSPLPKLLTIHMQL